MAIRNAVSFRIIRAGFFLGLAGFWFYGSVTDIGEKHHWDVIDFLNEHGWKFNVPKVVLALFLAAFAFDRQAPAWRRIIAVSANLAGLAHFGYWLWLLVPYNCFDLIPAIVRDGDPKWIVALEILGINLTAYVLCAWDLAAVVRKRTDELSWRSARVWLTFLLLIAIVIGAVAHRVSVERRKFTGSLEGMGVTAPDDSDIIRDAFSVKVVHDTFVRRLDLPGVDTSWQVILIGTLKNGRANFVAWHQDTGLVRYMFGRYNVISGASDTVFFRSSASSPPCLRSDGLTLAHLTGASETSGTLVIRDREHDTLAAVPMAGAWQIVGWADPHAILVSISNWRRESIPIRHPNGSETVAWTMPRTTSYRMVRFREKSAREWAVDRIDEIPLFPNYDGVRSTGAPPPSRYAMLLPGDSSAVVLRSSGRSTRGPSEEWIYHIDRKTKEPRGVFIDGFGTEAWSAPSAATYGRTRLVSDGPQPSSRSMRVDPKSIPYRAGTGRREVDTEALIAMIQKQHRLDTGMMDYRTPRQRLEWVSGDKTYLVEEYSDSWFEGTVLRFGPREFWSFMGKNESDTGLHRMSQRMRLTLLDDETKTATHYFASTWWRFPSSFAYDADKGSIFFASWDREGWTIRRIEFMK